MDFTSPFVGLTPPQKLTTEELLRALRIDVAAELDAINLYQAHIDATDDEQVKAVIAHIRDEEKEHVVEFMAAINALDAKQKDEFESPHPELGIEAGQAQVIPVTGMGVGLSTASGDRTPPEQASTGPEDLTVGSLLGKSQS